MIYFTQTFPEVGNTKREIGAQRFEEISNAIVERRFVKYDFGSISSSQVTACTYENKRQIPHVRYRQDILQTTYYGYENFLDMKAEGSGVSQDFLDRLHDGFEPFKYWLKSTQEIDIIHVGKLDHDVIVEWSPADRQAQIYLDEKRIFPGQLEHLKLELLERNQELILRVDFGESLLAETCSSPKIEELGRVTSKADNNLFPYIKSTGKFICRNQVLYFHVPKAIERFPNETLHILVSGTYVMTQSNDYHYGNVRFHEDVVEASGNLLQRLNWFSDKRISNPFNDAENTFLKNGRAISRLPKTHAQPQPLSKLLKAWKMG